MGEESKGRDPVNVICLKWGTLYGPDYVNRLYKGVKANMDRPFRFVCFTDDPNGLAEGVEAAPIPPPPEGWRYKWPGLFAKLCLFKDGVADLKGPTLFLDVDQIIIGDLGRFFDYRPGEFCIIYNWIEWRKTLFRKRPRIGNSSCFRFDAGKSNKVYEIFERIQRDPAEEPRFRKGSQKFQTMAMFETGKVSWWPKEWVCSFKRSLVPPFPLNLIMPARKPKNASILCFHGSPNPHEAISGYTKGHINTWVRPTKWVKDLWEPVEGE